MTAEPTTPLPESPHCRVRARVASIWADGPDEGTHPDWRPAAGEKVTLTPSIGSQLLTYDAAGPEPIIVTVEGVDCVVDADGWLAKSDGRPVYIAPTDDPLLSATGWTWTATIKGKSIAFSAPAGGVVDLALFIATPAVNAVERLSVAQVAAEYVALHHEELAGDDARPRYVAITPITANYTATLADEGALLLTDSATPVTITLPSGMPVGGVIDITQAGAGSVTVAGAGVVCSGQPVTRAQWSTVTCVALAAGWLVAGDVVA